MKKYFTAKDVLKILDVSEANFKMFLRHGFIIPSSPSGRRGKVNLYSLEDICLIKIIEDMRREGFSRDLIWRVLFFTEGSPKKSCMRLTKNIAISFDMASVYSDIKKWKEALWHFLPSNE